MVCGWFFKALIDILFGNYMSNFKVHREYLLCGADSDGNYTYSCIIAKSKKEAIDQCKHRGHLEDIKFVFSSHQLRKAALGKIREAYDEIERRDRRRMKKKT